MQHIIYINPDYDFTKHTFTELERYAGLNPSDFLAAARKSNEMTVYDKLSDFVHDFNDEKISDQAFLILLEDHKTTETIQLEELAEAVRQYGIPNPADPKSVILTIAPMDIHSMPVDPFDLMQDTLGYDGIEVTYQDKHGYLQDGYVTAIEVYDKNIQFHITVDMLKRKDIILQRYELHSDTVDSLHDLVLEGLNSEDRDWLVLYNSVLKHGAKKGLDIWSRYDGVYMAGIPDGWPHDIPADKDKQYAKRILDNLRDGKSVSESIEFLIP